MFTLRRFIRCLLLLVLGLTIFLGFGTVEALAAPPAGQPNGPVGYVLTGQLNIRSGPGLNYRVVTVVYRDDTLRLNGRTADNSWLRVRLPITGQEGWAMARYLEIGLGSIYDLPVVDGGSPPPAGPTARVSVDRLNVRGGPGLNYDITTVIRWGSVHPLIGRSADNGWLQIRLPDTRPTFAEPTGWVMARYIWSSVPIHTLPITDGGSPPPPENQVGIVTVPRLNVRSGPGLGYEIIGWARQGLQLRVEGRSSDSMWLKVSRGPYQQGWVYASYVSIIGPYSSLPVVE